jgi:hypothetical protein
LTPPAWPPPAPTPAQKGLLEYLVRNTSCPAVALSARQLRAGLGRPVSDDLSALFASCYASVSKDGAGPYRYYVDAEDGQLARVRAAFNPAGFLAAVERALATASVAPPFLDPASRDAAWLRNEMMYHATYPLPAPGLVAAALEQLETLGRVRPMRSDLATRRVAYLPASLPTGSRPRRDAS